MSPELQQVLSEITKFGDKTEAKQWFKENRSEIIPLLADLCEENENQYNTVVEDILENFPHGTIKFIREEIKRGVRQLLADRLRERLKPHWIDPEDAPDLTPDKNGNLLPTQRLLVDILLKSKHTKLVYDEHTKTNNFEVYGDDKLPWITTGQNSLKVEYQTEHKDKGVKEVIYYLADVKYQHASLKYYLANFFDQEVAWKALNDAIVYAAFQNKINIPQDYFNNGLEKWDGVDHMNLLARHAGAKDEKWARIVMRLIMLSIMARTYEPGYDFRVTALLVGLENIGKSWFTRQLSIHQRFYLQFTFEKNTNNAEVGRMLEGRMVVELADTGGVGNRNDNAIKAFLTQTYDNFRRMRSDAVEDIARNCIFIVTANSMEYYLGHVGNTRFWPLDVGKFDMEAIIAELPQLFAQAKYMWDHGERPRPTEEELELQQQMVLQQEVKPNFYYLLLRQLKLKNYAAYFEPDADGYDEGITINEIIQWFQNGDNLWYSNNKESQYRKDIIDVLKRYFHIEATYRKVPISKRTIADKPETKYKYRYIGNVPWGEFMSGLED